MSQDLPIDIHYNKLLDWLINRRHCDKQWQQSVIVIREKINAAIQDMPAVDEITKLLSGSYINYFHCLRIVELLKDTESATKNIFGRYSSQRMKDWQEVVKLYETDGVCLAEAASLLTRNVNYEIPSLKKQVTKCQQTQQESTRKEGEHASNAAELKDKFHKSCKQMGIEGKKIKSELVALAKDLPHTYQKMAKSTQEISKSVDYYTQFIEFTLKSKDIADSCIPVIKTIKNKGNITTYEYKNGHPPKKIEEPQVDFNLTEEEMAGDQPEEEIDWGAGTIDFSGISLDSGEGNIDFGVDLSVGEDADIDWGAGGDIDIEVVDTSVTVEEESSQEEGIARGEDALTLLDNTEMRNYFIDELLELEAFLTQRLQELTGRMNVISSSQFQNAPQSLHMDASAVEAMLCSVQDLVAMVTSSRMQDLFLIRSSPRYVDRLAESLKKTSSSSDKMLALSRLMVTRRAEALEEQRSVEPKITLIRSRTQELKKRIEGEISKKYQNRRVNIMGEINTV